MSNIITKFDIRDTPTSSATSFELPRTNRIFSDVTGGVFAKKSDGSYPVVYSGYWRGYGSGTYSSGSFGSGLTFTGALSSGTRYYNSATSGVGRVTFYDSLSTRSLTLTFNKPVPISGFSFSAHPSVGNAGTPDSIELQYETKGLWVSIGSVNCNNSGYTYLTTSNKTPATKWRLVVNGRSSWYSETLLLNNRWYIAHTANYNTQPFHNNDGSSASTTTLTSSNTHNYKTAGLIASNSSKPYVEVDANQNIIQRKFTGSKFEDSKYQITAGQVKQNTLSTNQSVEYYLI